MSGPRVAIQLISTGGIYGAERVLLELADYIRSRGWESHVVAMEGRGAGELVRLATAKGLIAEAFVTSGRLAFLPMAARLNQLLRRYPRAIVHAHNYKPDLLLALLGIPRRLACVATCHSSYRETRKLRMFAVLDKRAIRRFDGVVAVSREIYQELRTSGLPSQKVTLIHNGIDMPCADGDARTALRQEFGLPVHAKLIVQIGRLIQLKRSDLLLETLARLPVALDAHLLLVGEGDQRQALADLAKRRGIAQRVHFSGYRADIGQILAAADVLALTSDYEGLPIVVLEAMAMRCPIVSTRVGAIPDILQDGDDAWLVPTNNVGALAEAISEALGHTQLAHERAANAHKRFLRQHSRAAMGARYLEIYERAWAIRGWA
jgi:glycosyltransferase involved in cell wall biosynthesis